MPIADHIVQLKITPIIEKLNMTCVQTMNILIVNQSVVDMFASFFTLMTAVFEVDGTRMSRVKQVPAVT